MTRKPNARVPAAIDPAPVLSPARLLRALAPRRAAGATVVLTNGCFDLLHPGHLGTLRFARAQGDLLVVAINSDRSVRRLKGPGRPVLTEGERAAMLAALRGVDFVTVFGTTSVEPLVRRVRPDVLVKGGDVAQSGVGVVGREFVEGYGGRVALAPVVRGLSTSELVARVLRAFGQAPRRG